MGGRAPRQDPNIALAAMRSAETGQQALDFFKEQSKITNGWAAQDRAREQEIFIPLQDQFIADAKTWASPERTSQRMGAAEADVSQQIRLQDDRRMREAAALGVSPDSGRFGAASGRGAIDAALAKTGVRNMARREVASEGEARIASAINLGSGLAINPGTSMGLSNGAAGAGFSGAQQGYDQQANILNADYKNRLSAHQSRQGGLVSLASGVGSIIGASGGLTGLLALSSKKAKEDKRPMDGALRALGAMPIERWKYKDGMADGGQHIGPYAEDMKKATGVGDGKQINVMDAIGLTMGAVKELAAKVDKLAVTGMGAARAA